MPVKPHLCSVYHIGPGFLGLLPEGDSPDQQKCHYLAHGIYRKDTCDSNSKILCQNWADPFELPCPDRYHRVGPKCYYVGDGTQVTFRQGYRLCRLSGGKLAELKFRLEQLEVAKWLQTKKMSHNLAFIGVKDILREGE